MKLLAQNRELILPSALAGVIGLALLEALRYAGQPGGFFCERLMPGLVWLLLSIAIAAWARSRVTREPEPAFPERPDLPAVVLLAFLLLALFSSAVRDPWFYFLNWGKPGTLAFHLLQSWPARLCMLTAILTAFLLTCRASTALLISLALAGGQLAAILQFGQVTHWQMLYTDDHPSFLYRFWIYGDAFPCLAPYDPFWNGGRASAYMLSTGVPALGTLLLPLWHFAPVQQVYTPALAFVFIVLVPLVAAGAVRVAGGSPVAALCGGVLGLGVTQAHFLWLLRFGTLGAAFAAPLALVLAAGVYRVLWLSRLEKWNAALLILAGSVFVSWPLGPIMCLPAFALGLLAGGRQWTLRKAGFLLLCGAAVALVTCIFALGLLRHSDPFGLAAQAVKHPPWPAAVGLGWANLCAQFRQAHPFLLFLGLGGVFFFPRRGIARFFGPLLLGLAIVAGWGECWKPHLQLTRAAILLFFAAIVPASLWLDRLLALKRPVWAPLRAGVAAVLILTAWNCARIYGNRGPATCEVASPRLLELAGWLRSHTGDQGRILFAGPTVHAYGRGHVAFLPVLTGRQMMASDYYHFSPSRVEYEYPPREFRDNMEQVLEFLELYNVSHVVTYHPAWIERFRGLPERYEEVFFQEGGHPKVVFRVNRQPSFFLRGRGAVRAAINRLSVEVENPDQEVVLKYNWADGLAVQAPAEIRPFDAGHGIRFIALHPHGQRRVEIEYRRWL